MQITKSYLKNIIKEEFERFERLLKEEDDEEYPSPSRIIQMAHEFVRTKAFKHYSKIQYDILKGDQPVWFLVRGRFCDMANGGQGEGGDSGFHDEHEKETFREKHYPGWPSPEGDVFFGAVVELMDEMVTEKYGQIPGMIDDFRCMEYYQDKEPEVSQKSLRRNLTRRKDKSQSAQKATNTPYVQGRSNRPEDDDLKESRKKNLSESQEDYWNKIAIGVIEEMEAENVTKNIWIEKDKPPVAAPGQEQKYIFTRAACCWCSQSEETGYLFKEKIGELLSTNEALGRARELGFPDPPEDMYPPVSFFEKILWHFDKKWNLVGKQVGDEKYHCPKYYDQKLGAVRRTGGSSVDAQMKQNTSNQRNVAPNRPKWDDDEIRVYFAYTEPMGRGNAKVMRGEAGSAEEFAENVSAMYPGYRYLEIWASGTRIEGVKPLYIKRKD